jgi:Zn-dependent metalloprotease
MSRLRSALCTALLLAVSLSLLPAAGLAARGGPAPAAQPTPPQPADLIASLRAQTGDGLRIAYHAETGKLRFIGAGDGQPLRQPAALAPGATPEQAARQFLAAYGALFGLGDQAQELTVMRAAAERGAAFVRFQQRYQGIPILGGELIVNLDQQRDVRSVSGELLPNLRLNVTPRISAAAARDRALAAIAKYYGGATADLRASAPELWIFNPALLGGPGLRRNALTWRMELRGEAAGAEIRELVLVDAQLGVVALHFNQIAHAKQRFICDANNVRDNNSNQNDNCSTRQPPVFVRQEGQAATGNLDVDRAYDYSGQTYDYFFNNFGRDSLDGQGMPLYSLVRYCTQNTATACPYLNANWNGSQMTYGDGFSLSDDVVAHELSHGVTEFTSGLFYYYQSGAINESMSDVFGELLDLTNGAGADTAGVRWLLGEDLPASFGVIRNMKDPPTEPTGVPTPFFSPAPDRMGSLLYTADEEEGDGGGVHTNSGVNNKAAYLLTDGDSFNGQTITGLGASKVGQIYYRVETNYLTSASDYQDLATALRAACGALVGSHNITTADCAEVDKAVLATEMDQTPAAAPAPEAPICGAGTAPQTLLFDKLESATGSWQTSAAVGLNPWFYPMSPNPILGSGAYATSGDNNIWGYDRNTTSDSDVRMTSSVELPANAFLRFNHAFGFDDGFFQGVYRTFDGGVVEYSVNNGATWTDAGSLIVNNGYNGTITALFDNPLGGKQAFVAESNGYISSRLNLASLAGQSVRFRFRMGTDESVDDYGWFIDDFHIYQCAAIVSGPHKIYLPSTSLAN